MIKFEACGGDFPSPMSCYVQPVAFGRSRKTRPGISGWDSFMAAIACLIPVDVYQEDPYTDNRVPAGWRAAGQRYGNGVIGNADAHARKVLLTRKRIGGLNV